jgi:hypothetical protein
MGFFKGFFIGIPIALYFGEKGLHYPFTINLKESDELIEVRLEYKFVNALRNDI